MTFPTLPADIGERLREVFKRQQQAFRRNMYPSCRERVTALDRLESMVLRHQEAICEAAHADFGCRAPQVTRMSDVMPTLLRVRYNRPRLKRWMRPNKMPVNRLLFGLADNCLMYQPLGVIGVMAPWNFPFDLTLGPLVDILSAGNRACIKPSELTPASSALLAEMVAETFDRDEVAVLPGGPEVAQAFCRLPFDHLLFTGGIAIGKKVMQAASENLTPVTLELGGKCPAIVTREALGEASVSNILAGKLLNAGQMCISTDYVLLPEGEVDRFVSLARAAAARLYPTVIDNIDYTSIINERHFDRLLGYLEDARARGGQILELSPARECPDRRTRKLPPTLVLDPKDEMRLMQEEIFGPILPLVTYRSIDEAIDYVNDHPRPLALYLFCNDRRLARRVLHQTVSGGACINATVLHSIQPSLPFGGVGPSGMGHHHGFGGFETFSKLKPVFSQARWSQTHRFYPPYGSVTERILRWVIDGPRSLLGLRIRQGR